MGGYGLFGVITELELDMVPNALLAPRYEEMSGLEIGDAIRPAARLRPGHPDGLRADGRRARPLLRAGPADYVPAHRRSEQDSCGDPDPDSSAMPRAISSASQLDSDRAKRFRWWTEAGLGPRFAGKATRNSLMNEPVVTLDDRDPFRTDILHEYFVAPARFAEFVKACQAVIPGSFQQLLNITLRFVNTDHDSVLAYATEPAHRRRACCSRRKRPRAARATWRA